MTGERVNCELRGALAVLLRANAAPVDTLQLAELEERLAFKRLPEKLAQHSPSRRTDGILDLAEISLRSLRAFKWVSSCSMARELRVARSIFFKRAGESPTVGAAHCL